MRSAPPRTRKRAGIWAALGAATTLVVLAVAQQVSSATSSCAQTLPSPLVTMCPGDPLKPDVMNQNFSNLISYTQSKLGTVGQPTKIGGEGGCFRVPIQKWVNAGESFSIQANAGFVCGSGQRFLFDSCDAPGADLTHVGINASTGAWCAGVNTTATSTYYTLTVSCCYVSY